MPNKHSKSTWSNDVNNKKCPKRGCNGRLIHCTVSYKRRGPLHEELECSDCGLVKKDPRFRMQSKNKFAPRKFYRR